MAKAGGRKYARDKNGRFASTGGGGGKSASSVKGAKAGGKVGSGKIRMGSNRPHGSAPKGTIIKNTGGRAGVGPASKAPAPKAVAKPAAKKRPGLSPEKRALAGEMGKIRGQMKAINQGASSQAIRNIATRDAVKFAKENLASKGKPAAQPKAKSASTRSTNSARAADLKAKGTTAIGGRVKAKGFAGGKGAQERAGGLRGGSTKALNRKAGTIGAGTRSGMKANAAQAGKMRNKASGGGKVNKATRMSKAPANAAKERYKELSGKARRSGPERSAADNRAAAGARRSMQSMVAKRGVSKPAKRKGKK